MQRRRRLPVRPPSSHTRGGHVRYRTMGIGAVAIAAAVGLLPAESAGANPGNSAKPATFDQFAAQSFDRQAAVLNPLRAIAGALDELGRGSQAADYGDVVMDPVADTVTLYATSPAGAARLIAGAEHDHPEIDTKLIRVASAAYSKADLHAARDRLAAQADRLPYRLVSIAVAVDGSGLEVGVDNPAAAAQTAPLTAGGVGTDPGSIAGVAVVVSKGSGMT